jgi:hypothetical protein
VLGLPVRLGGVTVGTPDRLLRLPARVAERRGPGPCSLLPRSGRVHSCHCRGRPQRRRARCPAAVGARLSGDHRARRRVFDGARSSGPITAFNNLRRPAARDTQSKTGDVAQRLYRPAGCRPKPRGDRRSAAQGLAGITAVKRSHYPPLSRGVHIADAPIELLQGVFKCLRHSAPPRLRAHGFEPSAVRPERSGASCSTVSATATGYHDCFTRTTSSTS